MKTFIIILSLLAIAQSFFLTVVLAGQLKRKIKANYTLFAFLLVNTTILVRDSAYYFGFYLDIPTTILTEFYWSFTTGQLFYFYVKQALLKEEIKPKQVILHFLPLVLVLIYWVVILYINKGTNYVPAHYTNEFSYIKTTGVVLYWHITPIIYFIISLRLLSKDRNSFIKNEKNYVRWMIYSFFLVNMISISVLYLSGTFPSMRSYILPSSILILSTLTVLVSYIILNKGFQVVQSKLYKPATIDFSFVKKLMDELDELIEKDTLFVSQSVSLQSLAKKLNTNANYLSMSINHYHNLSFKDFINKKRVEFAKNQLCKPESNRYTILSIAEESGFKSKDAFYRAFKKFTGYTPTQFKKVNTI